MNPVVFADLEETVRRQAPHLIPSEVAVLAQIVERLITAYQPEKVYLFGSKARGDAGPDSDFDLLVVVPDTAPIQRRRGRLAYEVLWGTGTAADIIVWPASRFAERAAARASLPATVLNEGKLLYAA